jgi:hypothetical protein
VQQRRPGTDLRTVMRCFGSADIAFILARIARALLLGAALEARLLRRAAQEEKTASRANPPPHPQPCTRHSTDRPANATAFPPAGPPTEAEFAAALRRRPMGALIAEMCRDLGIVPSQKLWWELNMAVIDTGGNAVGLVKEAFKRLRRGFAAVPVTETTLPAGWPGPCPPFVAVTATGPP